MYCIVLYCISLHTYYRLSLTDGQTDGLTDRKKDSLRLVAMSSILVGFGDKNVNQKLAISFYNPF